MVLPSFGVMPAALAARRGLAIEYVSGPAKFSGRVLRERMVIEVNASMHPNRQRFTIGHELGHYVLRHSSVACLDNRWSTADPRSRNEHEANVFASELLMPEPWVRERWAELRDYKKMAKLFEVSPEAMFRRLQDVKIV